MTGIKGLIPDPHLEGGGLHQIERGGHLNVVLLKLLPPIVLDAARWLKRRLRG